jgi:hypothetical protein
LVDNLLIGKVPIFDVLGLDLLRKEEERKTKRKGRENSDLGRVKQDCTFPA